MWTKYLLIFPAKCFAKMTTTSPLATTMMDTSTTRARMDRRNATDYDSAKMASHDALSSEGCTHGTRIEVRNSARIPHLQHHDVTLTGHPTGGPPLHRRTECPNRQKRQRGCCLRLARWQPCSMLSADGSARWRCAKQCARRRAG